MSRGIQNDHIMATKEIIALETDDFRYFLARIRKDAREFKESGKNKIIEE